MMAGVVTGWTESVRLPKLAATAIAPATKTTMVTMMEMRRSIPLMPAAASRSSFAGASSTAASAGFAQAMSVPRPPGQGRSGPDCDPRCVCQLQVVDSAA